MVEFSELNRLLVLALALNQMIFVSNRLLESSMKLNDGSFDSTDNYNN